MFNKTVIVSLCLLIGGCSPVNASHTVKGSSKVKISNQITKRYSKEELAVAPTLSGFLKYLREGKVNPDTSIGTLVRLSYPSNPFYVYKLTLANQSLIVDEEDYSVAVLDGRNTATLVLNQKVNSLQDSYAVYEGFLKGVNSLGYYYQAPRFKVVHIDTSSSKKINL